MAFSKQSTASRKSNEFPVLALSKPIFAHSVAVFPSIFSGIFIHPLTFSCSFNDAFLG